MGLNGRHYLQMHTRLAESRPVQEFEETCPYVENQIFENLVFCAACNGYSQYMQRSSCLSAGMSEAEVKRATLKTRRVFGKGGSYSSVASIESDRDAPNAVNYTNR